MKFHDAKGAQSLVDTSRGQGIFVGPNQISAKILDDPAAFLCATQQQVPAGVRVISHDTTSLQKVGTVIIHLDSVDNSASVEEVVNECWKRVNKIPLTKITKAMVVVPPQQLPYRPGDPYKVVNS